MDYNQPQWGPQEGEPSQFDEDDPLHPLFVKARDPKNYCAQLPPEEETAFNRREAKRLEGSKIHKSVKRESMHLEECLLDLHVAFGEDEIEAAIDRATKQKYVARSLLMNGGNHGKLWPMISLSSGRQLIGLFHRAHSYQKFFLFGNSGKEHSLADTTQKIFDVNNRQKLEFSREDLLALVKVSDSEILPFIEDVLHFQKEMLKENPKKKFSEYWQDVLKGRTSDKVLNGEKTMYKTVGELKISSCAFMNRDNVNGFVTFFFEEKKDADKAESLKVKLVLNFNAFLQLLFVALPTILKCFKYRSKMLNHLVTELTDVAPIDADVYIRLYNNNNKNKKK